MAGATSGPGLGSLRPALLAAGLVALGALAWHLYQQQPVERVADAAGLLDNDQEERIATYHERLLAGYDIDYRVITGNDVGDIDRYAARAFRERDVGSASSAGHGLLLVIDPAQDLLRIEVSRSLEPIYVDAFVAYIEQRQMTEFFALDQVADGILATTEMVVTRAQRAEAGQGLSNAIAVTGSAGGGARSDARLDEDSDPAGTSNEPVRVEGEGPKAVLAAYRRVLEARNDNRDLAIFSARTREKLADWPVTPAQMDNEARTIRQCPIDAVREKGDRAVIRAPIEERQCPPYFFVFEDGRWRLDLATMHEAIRMNQNNAWGLNLGAAPQYRFAFRDWMTD